MVWRGATSESADSNDHVAAEIGDLAASLRRNVIVRQGLRQGDLIPSRIESNALRSACVADARCERFWRSVSGGGGCDDNAIPGCHPCDILFERDLAVSAFAGAPISPSPAEGGAGKSSRPPQHTMDGKESLSSPSK